jgi:ribosomal protein L40E
MTSSKCKQCGLVNPLNVSVCKRCGSALTGEVASNTPSGNEYEAAAKQTGIKVPDTLTVCSICGTNNDVAIRVFKRTYTPNWVWLFLPIGILPAGIIGLAVQVKHTLSLPICSRCNQRRSLSGVVSWLSIIACIFLIFVTIGMGIAFKSWIVFLSGCGLTAAVAYLAGRYERSVNPRFTEFTKQRVEIDVPGQGRLLVLDRQL